VVIQRPLPNGPTWATSHAVLIPKHALASETYAAKLAHAQLAPRYDIGLFGNSRVVMVSRSDVDLNGRTFFNFAVPGQSVRTSIALLEDLVQRKKTPRIVLIGFDNAALEFYQNPDTRRPWTLVRAFLRDLLVRASEISLKDRARMAFRHVYSVWLVGAYRYFNFRQLRQGLAYRFDAHFSAAGPAADPKYRPDGSRRQQRLKPAAQLQRLIYAIPSVLQGYLAADLRRLAAVARQANVQVVLFETPLAPGALVGAGSPSANVRRTRKTLRRVCASEKLICRLTPDNRLDAGALWADGSHPGALGLGRFVTRLIGQTVKKAANRP